MLGKTEDFPPPSWEKSPPSEFLRIPFDKRVTNYQTSSGSGWYIRFYRIILHVRDYTFYQSPLWFPEWWWRKCRHEGDAWRQRWPTCLRIGWDVGSRDGGRSKLWLFVGRPDKSCIRQVFYSSVVANIENMLYSSQDLTYEMHIILLGTNVILVNWHAFAVSATKEYATKQSRFEFLFIYYRFADKYQFRLWSNFFRPTSSSDST